MQTEDIVIVAAKRTPMGAMLGTLASLQAPQLMAAVHSAALEQAAILGQDIDEVITGCVLQAGIGQAPARQALIAAHIPASVGATTINKMCGSGLKAVMLAHDLIKARSANIILAGGMESMSNAPYLLAKARAGYRLGHGELIDHMYRDGLEDAYDKGKLMGYFADKTAAHYAISREHQDAFAIESMTRALAAQAHGAFAQEIVPIDITDKKGVITTVSIDESPSTSKISKIPTLKPAFQTTGTVTAGNASSISDGAASLILMHREEARKRNLQPLARIVAHASFAEAPEWFTRAPIQAIQKVLQKAGWQAKDVDLYEINEAFAVVVLLAMQELGLASAKINVHGGACALGHPIGASGARILVTLLYALQRAKKNRGVAALCIGGGEAVAIAVETSYA